MNTSVDSAFKYQCKSLSFIRILKDTRHSDETAVNYMKRKFAENPEYRFAYVEGIYKGSSFLELLTNVSGKGKAQFAAFQLGGDYFVSTDNRHTLIGPIIIQLEPVKPTDFGILDLKDKSTIK